MKTISLCIGIVYVRSLDILIVIDITVYIATVYLLLVFSMRIFSQYTEALVSEICAIVQILLAGYEDVPPFLFS